jgi:acyl carrier protein
MMGMDDQRDVEHWLVGICQELGLQLESASDDFFAAGASSITAVKLISQVEEKFGEDALPPEDLFEKSCINDIAASIRRNSAHADASSTP